MRFFVYSRKSVFTGKGESIENQIEMCKAYIKAKHPAVGDGDITVYEDEGFSAKNTDRPQFQQMLRDIRLYQPDYVVCYRLDRISRNVSDFSSLIEELNTRNISFVCIKEEFDTSKPMGKAMMYIASVFAQLERETIAERVRDNMLMLAKTGRWLGGTTPTGYTSEKMQEIILDGKVTTACRLKNRPEELKAVDVIYAKFLELHSVSGVGRYLMRQQIYSRSGRPYSLLGIKQILQNPVYCIADASALDYFTAQGADVCFTEKDCGEGRGLLAYNKRDYKKKHAPRQSVEKWIVAAGKHEGRVPGEKWVAVQHILADNIPTGKRPARPHNDYALLSGLVRCGKCGGKMFSKQRSGKQANPGLFDYMCQSKLRGGAALCGCQNINGQLADQAVCSHLARFLVESASVYARLEKYRRLLQCRGRENPFECLDERIKTCSGEMDRLVNSLSQGRLGPAFVGRVNARMDELDRKRNALLAERARMEAERNASPVNEGQIGNTVGALANLKENFSNLSIYDKRALIQIMVESAVWEDGDLHLFLRGE